MSGNLSSSTSDPEPLIVPGEEVPATERDPEETQIANELETTLNMPVHLWTYGISDPRFERPKTTLLHVMKFANVFKTKFTTFNMESKLNFFIFIENMLSLINFMINSFDDLDSISVEALTQFRSDIGSVLTNVDEEFSTEVGELVLRIDSHYTDILAALKHVRNREESEAAQNTQEETSSEVLHPFFSSANRFGTSVERDFMRKLHLLLVQARRLPADRICNELEGIFESTPPHTAVFLFESTRDTAMRALLMILHPVMNVVDPFGRRFLESSCVTICLLTLTQSLTASSRNYRLFTNARHVYFMYLLSYLRGLRTYEIPQRTTTDELQSSNRASFSDSTQISVLWKKLEGVISLNELLKDHFTICSICLEEIMLQHNFAILDVCPHLFCNHCIENWFNDERKASCPNCREEIEMWTTKDVFLQYLKQSSKTVEKSQPNTDDSTNPAEEPYWAGAGDNTNRATEPSLPEAGDTIYSAVEPSLPEAGDTINSAVEPSLPEAGDTINSAVEPYLRGEGDHTNRTVEPSLPEAGDTINSAVKPSLPEAGDTINSAVKPSLAEAGDTINSAVESSLPEAGGHTNRTGGSSFPEVGNPTNGAAEYSLPEIGEFAN